MIYLFDGSKFKETKYYTSEELIKGLTNIPKYTSHKDKDGVNWEGFFIENQEELDKKLRKCDNVYFDGAVFGEDGIEHGVRDLVRDLVRMSPADRFGREKLSSGHVQSPFCSNPSRGLHLQNRLSLAPARVTGQPQRRPFAEEAIPRAPLCAHASFPGLAPGHGGRRRLAGLRPSSPEGPSHGNIASPRCRGRPTCRRSRTRRAVAGRNGSSQDAAARIRTVTSSRNSRVSAARPCRASSQGRCTSNAWFSELNSAQSSASASLNR